MQHPNGEAFQIDLDFQAHRLAIVTVSGSQRAMVLGPMPVSEFYRRLMALLDDLGLHSDIWPMPVEISGAFPFERDDLHGTYEPAQAHQFWQALVTMLPVSTEFRSRFIGKASPIHLFLNGDRVGDAEGADHIFDGYDDIDGVVQLSVDSLRQALR